MWDNEKAFGKSVMTKLKREGFTCVRLESASTSSGIPDLFVMGYGLDFFIEFKNCKQYSFNDLYNVIMNDVVTLRSIDNEDRCAMMCSDLSNNKEIRAKHKIKEIKIPWRSGQQAWALTYKHKHMFKDGTAKNTITLVGLKDGVLIIRMCDVFNNNIINDNAQYLELYTPKAWSSLFIISTINKWIYSELPKVEDSNGK